MDYLSESASNFLNELLNFVSCRSIADIILKLILLEVPSLEAKKILYYVQFTFYILYGITFFFHLAIKNATRTKLTRKTNYFY